MRSKSLFLENLHYVPAAGWTRSAFSVLRAGMVEAASDYRIERDVYPGQDILFCLSGSGIVETLGARADIRPGHLVWIANEAPHAHAANRHDPWTVLWFRLEGPDPAALRRQLFGEEFPRIAFAEGTSPAPWFERLFAAMRSRDVRLDFRLNQLVAEFLTIVDNNMAGRTSEVLPPALTALVSAMRANLRLSWSAIELSEITGVSHSQTRRLFRKYLRASPRQWLIRERLMQAQALLVQTSTPIAEVAELCGFCDVYHLSREFKRSVGVSPAAWRRNELGIPARRQS